MRPATKTRRADIWIARTDCLALAGQAPLSDALRGMLDHTELTRLSRLRFESDRHVYLLSHGLCRVLLGRAMGMSSPYRGCFVKERLGKPRVQGSRPYFSISHSAPWVAVMVCPDAACGVDIESHRDMQRCHMAVGYCLSESERRVLQEAESAEHMFMKIWTLKEAYLKAHGVGLSRPMTEFSVIDRAGAVTTSDDGALRMQAHHRRAEAYHLAAWTVCDDALPVREHLLDTAQVIALCCGGIEPSAPRRPALHLQAA